MVTLMLCNRYGHNLNPVKTPTLDSLAAQGTLPSPLSCQPDWLGGLTAITPSHVPVPSFPTIVAAGVKLENYYIAAVCSPTRASLLTVS